MIKILHTGDLHLDSPFANLSPAIAAVRRRELRETFSAMMAYARTAAVDIVLIAGDLFDRRFATSETLELIREEFAALPCPVVISPGNHDPADGRGIWHGGALPSNVYIFKEEKLERIVFEDIGLDVYGYGFTSDELTKSPIAGEYVRDRHRASVLLCHGDITSPMSKDAPLSKAQIESFGADYTALGHIHNGEEYSGNAGGRIYAYCGCPEGRDFGECGVKGAIICEIDGDPMERRVMVTRKPFCRKKYEDITVPVDGAVGMSEIYRAARDAAILCDERTILRLTFTGAVDPGIVIDPAAVEAALPGVAALTVRDRTTPALGFSDSDLTVRGEFCRILRPMLESADPAEREKAILALKIGLSALNGND